MHCNEIFNLLRCKVELVLETMSGFTNPLGIVLKTMNCTFCVPAKPGIAKDLIEADDIGRKAVADFTDSLLAKKYVFHIPIKCYKLVKF